MKALTFLIPFCFCCLLTFACNHEDDKRTDDPPPNDTGTFAKGADVSWVTEMEHNNIRFYNGNGHETECMELLQSLGMNAIRLRVWVDPADGWCNKTDVLVKARRAMDLGMRVMIDFHYSDVWADPAHQTKPAAWTSMNFAELLDAVEAHTTEVLTALKNWNITPEWVQVGNETGNGMLWDDGKASVNMAQYAQLNNSGYNAVKSIFPHCKVIVHVHNGQNNDLFRWLFDGLKNNGGKWDMIGMSVYPEPGTWLADNNSCLSNITDMISRYGKPVIICETGMSWDEAVTAKLFLTDLITRAGAVPNNMCKGVFYWEPETWGGWEGYTKGAFDNSGKPTVALDAFGD
jgi:arabinogalactan endo-1,4-beta-galactosidase